MFPTQSPEPKTPAPAAPPAPPPELPGAISRDGDGWIVARPPRLIEVARRVLGFPRTLAIYGDLISTSVKRELRGRFTGTVLGLAWPLVAPVFLFLVYYFIFTNLLQVKFGELTEEQEAAMGVFMFVGILVWTSVAESLMRCCNVIVENGNIIKKLVFPAEVLPLNVVLVNTITMLFGMAVYLLVTTLTPVWPAVRPLDLLWVPVLLVLQVLFCYGLGLFLSALQVFLRDTMQVVNILVTVWMFITPVFWTPELIMRGELEKGILPADTDMGPYLPFIQGNPTNHLVFAWRSVLMRREPGMIFDDSPIAPSLLESVATFGVWALAFFVVGYAFFILSQRRFADEV
jgi:ABC-type polysaccharide/polyol phosphate export permease